MFSAFALQPWLQGARSTLTRLSPDMLSELQPFLDRTAPGATTKDTELKQLLRTIGVAFVAVLIAIVSILQYSRYEQGHCFERAA